MRVLILADERFASRERSLLSRLEIGLADEGVRIVHAVPSSSTVIEPAVVFTRSVSFEARGWAWDRRARVGQLVRRVLALGEEPEEQTIDLVHVFGGSMWKFGAMVARELGAELALDVWRSGLVDRAVRIQSRERGTAAFFAPDPAIERALAAGGLAGAVRLTPWGVHCPSSPRAVLAAERSASLMFVGTGRDPAWFMAAFRGAARCLRRFESTMIFMDSDAARRSGVWDAARRDGLSDRLTLIEDFEARRDLLLQGDILVLPEASGEARTITLDAMAGGMVVAAAADPFVSALVDRQTALLVPQPSEAAWESVLSGVLQEPASIAGLVRSARDFVKAGRRASDHVAAVLNAYSWMSASRKIGPGSSQS